MLESAQEVFATFGYLNATIDEIVSGAGASRATFYLHFSSKLEIFMEASAASIAGVSDYYSELDAILENGTRADFRSWLDGVIGWFEAHGNMIPAWAEAAMTEPEVARAGLRTVDDFLSVMPKFRSQWPASRRSEAWLRISLFLMQLERFFQRQAVIQTWEADRATLLEVLTDIWFPGFKRS